MNLNKEALRKMPTLYQGHFDDLKIEANSLRVWLSRVDDSITVEQLINGKWKVVSYEH